MLVQRGQNVGAETSEDQPPGAREAFPDLQAASAKQDVGLYCESCSEFQFSSLYVRRSGAGP